MPATPTFTWNAAAGAATYSIQVATDAGFTNVVASASGLTGTTWSGASLNTNTMYYWRVQATNACGTGTYSSVFNFSHRRRPWRLRRRHRAQHPLPIRVQVRRQRLDLQRSNWY